MYHLATPASICWGPALTMTPQNSRLRTLGGLLNCTDAIAAAPVAPAPVRVTAERDLWAIGRRHTRRACTACTACVRHPPLAVLLPDCAPGAPTVEPGGFSFSHAAGSAGEDRSTAALAARHLACTAHPAWAPHGRYALPSVVPSVSKARAIHLPCVNRACVSCWAACLGSETEVDICHCAQPDSCCGGATAVARRRCRAGGGGAQEVGEPDSEEVSLVGEGAGRREGPQLRGDHLQRRRAVRCVGPRQLGHHAKGSGEVACIRSTLSTSAARSARPRHVQRWRRLQQSFGKRAGVGGGERADGVKSAHRRCRAEESMRCGDGRSQSAGLPPSVEAVLQRKLYRCLSWQSTARQQQHGDQW